MFDELDGGRVDVMEGGGSCVGWEVTGDGFIRSMCLFEKG